MSHNVYVGANVDSVIFALATPDPDDDLPALVSAIETFVATDVSARLGAIAQEISWTRPHVVGLQEVFVVDIDIPGVATIYADFMEILQAKLADLGLHYEIASAIETTHAILPGVSLLDRDFILVRSERVDVTEANAAIFEVNEGDSGAGFPVVRGWTAIQAQIGGRQIQFINTHMASGQDDATARLRELQAAELVALARTDRPVILMGDLNGQPDSAMHQIFTEGGFTDVWSTLVPSFEGLTCCHADDLSNPTKAFYERIDYVMVRGFERGHRNVRGLITRLGLRPWEKVPGPFYDIWPSDHAGLAAALWLPRH